MYGRVEADRVAAIDPTRRGGGISREEEADEESDLERELRRSRVTTRNRPQFDSKGELSTSLYRERIESRALLQVQTDLGNVVLRGFGLGLNRVDSGGTAHRSNREERKKGTRSEDEAAKCVFRSVGRRFRERS